MIIEEMKVVNVQIINKNFLMIIVTEKFDFSESEISDKFYKHT